MDRGVKQTKIGMVKMRTGRKLPADGLFRFIVFALAFLSLSDPCVTLSNFRRKKIETSS